MGIGAGWNGFNERGMLMNQQNTFVPFLNLLNKQAYAQPQQPSMVADMIARADAASKNVNVPTMEQLMPYLSALYTAPQAQAPIAINSSYGAGRFLSPSQGQQTGGVLGFNFNAPSMNKA